MPGPVIHHIVAREVAAELRAKNPAFSTLAESIESPEHLPFLNFGSVGPDFLFFNIEDANSSMGTMVNLYFKVAEWITGFRDQLVALAPDAVIELYKKYERFKDDVVQSSVLLSELEQTTGEMRSHLELLKATLTNAILEIVPANKFFDEFEQNHPLQKPPVNKKDWWWFDVLHYRRTGQFARHLLANSAPGTPEHAYAIGYLSHVGADVVGHPYVNMISGGPYRTHSQRHKLVENFNDVWAMNAELGQDLTISRLWNIFDFQEPGGNLPASLNQMLTTAFQTVYQDDYDPKPSADDLNTAYKLWLKWFKMSTETGTPPPRMVYSLTAEIQEAWDKFKENAEEIEKYVGKSGKGEKGLWGFLSMLAALVIGALALAVAILDFVFGSLATLGLAPFRFFMSLLYNTLYDAFSHFRLLAASSGLAFPLRENLGHYNLVHLNHAAIPDRLGNIAQKYCWLSGTEQYPMLKFSVLGGESHLVYPFLLAPEPAPATVAPERYFSGSPQIYYKQNWGVDASLLDLIENLGNADLPMLHSKVQDPKLGNAAQLTAELYSRFFEGRPLPDFNLDGDRGAGYRTWMPVTPGAASVTPDFTNL